MMKTFLKYKESFRIYIYRDLKKYIIQKWKSFIHKDNDQCLKFDIRFFIMKSCHYDL